MPRPDTQLQNHRARGWVHVHSATLVDLFRLVDVAWIFSGLWYASWTHGIAWNNELLLLGALSTGLFTILVSIWPLYRSWRLNSLRSELGHVSMLWITSIAGISLLGNFSLVDQPLDQILPLWGLFTLLGLTVTRLIIRTSLRLLRIQGANFRTAAIIGANDTAERVAHEITNTSWMGLRLTGVFDDRTEHGGRLEPNLQTAGTLDDLIELAISGRVDIVYITLPMSAQERIHQFLTALHDSTVTVYYVPDLSAFGLLYARWETLRGLPLVSLIDTPHKGVDAVIKRTFDIVAANFILLLIALPMAALAIAIKATSKGPVFFLQERYGLDGKRFKMWKFRTMTVCEDGEKNFKQATKNDSRVTPLGRLLRRTSADELPQLINVLQGNMSLVGPRPHPVALNESQRKLIDGYMLRHKVKPGITGWAQVNGFRGETDTIEKMRKRVEYDLEYINNWSLWLDLRILFLTLGRAFTDPDAY